MEEHRVSLTLVTMDQQKNNIKIDPSGNCGQIYDEVRRIYGNVSNIKVSYAGKLLNPGDAISKFSLRKGCSVYAVFTVDGGKEY